MSDRTQDDAHVEAVPVISGSGVLPHEMRVLVLDPDVASLLADGSLADDQAAGLTFAGCATGGGALQELMQHDCPVVVIGATLPDIAPGILLSEMLKVRSALTVILTTRNAPVFPEGHAPAGLSCHTLDQPISPGALVAAARAAVRQVLAEQPRSPANHPRHALLRCVNRFAAMSAVTSKTADALEQIGCELAQILNVEAAAILLLRSTGAPHRIVCGRRPLDDAFIERVLLEMDDAFSRISGGSAAPSRPIVRQPEASGPPAVACGRTLTLPLLINHQVRGVVCFANASAGEMPSEIGELAFRLANHAVQTYYDFWMARNMATRDPLTKLYNKGMFLDSLKQSWLLCQRNARPLGLLLIDLDHFKSLNDRHGHIVGDEVLCEAARLLAGMLRASDLSARFGGDEFAVILPESDQASTHAIADRLVESFRKHRFMPDQANLTVTLSIGATAEVPSPGSSYHDLLAAVDTALYQAKRNGRNQVCEPGTRSEPASPTAAPLPSDKPAESLRRGRVLIVDDESMVLQVLGHIARSFGFDATLGSSLEDAIHALEEHADGFDVVVTDLCLGTASGIDLLTLLGKSAPQTVKIVVSGYATKDVAIECMRHGAFDFIEKPFSAVQVGAALERAMEHRRLILENRRHQEHLEEMVRQRSESLTDALASLRRSYAQTIRTLAAMLDVRESQTGLHSRQVGEAVRLIGRQMGVAANKIEVMEMGAILHDIGKIGIPDAILLKPDSLTEDEWRIMRSHCRIGYDLLSEVPFLQDAAELALHHHERFDGKGYPSGLKGEEISLEARIFSVADSYHAMRTDRPYHPALSPESAMAELVNNAGTQFDPAVVAAFKKYQSEIEGLFSSGQALNGENAL